MSKICLMTLGDMEKVPTGKRATGMAPELMRLGHRVSIVAWDVVANHKRLEMECPEAEPLWVNAKSKASEIWNKLRAVRKWRPDVIYLTSFGFRNLAFLRPLYARRAKVVAEHCELYSAFGHLKHRLDLHVLERRSVTEVDGLACASQYLKRFFDQRIDSLRCDTRTVYLPYAYPEYLVPDGVLREAGPKRILFMAALWKNYGILDIIQAAKMLKARRADFVVDVLGTGPAWEEALALIRELGVESVVKMRGFVPETDLKNWFSRTSVFLAPLHDTIQDIARCPSKVYYYLPYQKPIVTCELGDPKDLLKEDGYYYRPDDIESMADALERALVDSDTFVFRNVHVAEHSWSHRARQFEAWCGQNGWLS